MNKAILIGRLTRDPELRYLPNGTSVASFTIAVDRRFTNQQGERETDFISIVVWRNLAETCAKYLTKGRLVAVLGRIQTRNYEARDGTRRYVTEIVADEVQFLDRARGGGDAPPSQGSGFDDPTGFSPIDGDDELPF
jgi:single-strand DNA-binding protein